MNEKLFMSMYSQFPDEPDHLRRQIDKETAERCVQVAEKYATLKLEEKNREIEQLKEILQTVKDYINTPETTDFINRKLNLISTPETK